MIGHEVMLDTNLTCLCLHNSILFFVINKKLGYLVNHNSEIIAKFLNILVNMGTILRTYSV